MSASAEGDYPTHEGWVDVYRDPAKAASYEERRTRSALRRLSWSREHAIVGRLVRAVATSGRWLDLACGPGRFLDLLPPGAVGVDLSLAMLALARPRAHGAALVGCSGTRLPFASGAFEGIVCLRFLHHLARSERAAVLGEMHRTARRFAVVGYPSDRTLRSVLRRLRGRGLGPRRGPEAFAAEAREHGWVVRKTVAVFPLFGETTLALLERVETAS